MIVCLCSGSSESEIICHIQNGAYTLELIQEACGAGGGCQSCHLEISSLLADEKSCAMTRGAGAPHEKEQFANY
ncbi:MAG: (2Fe-2S)-binding protein [Myxococcota bacterium]